MDINQRTSEDANHCGSNTHSAVVLMKAMLTGITVAVDIDKLTRINIGYSLVRLATV